MTQEASGNFPPTDFQEVMVEEFADRLGLHLKSLVSPNFAGFSPVLEDVVDKMVAPSARESYRGTDAIFRLLIGEVSSVGQRARRYQYIERYKFFAKMPNPDMGMAFAEHLWSARGAEVYSILERGESLIRFAAGLAAELGSGDAKSPGRFSKRFRSAFAYRLRERHRITHAHERPSLTSRILQMGELKADGEREAVQRVLGRLIVGIQQFFENFAQLEGVDDPAPDPRDRNAFQRWYLRRSDSEALAMWTLFREGIEAAVGMPEPSGASMHDAASDK